MEQTHDKDADISGFSLTFHGTALVDVLLIPND